MRRGFRAVRSLLPWGIGAVLLFLAVIQFRQYRAWWARVGEPRRSTEQTLLTRGHLLPVTPPGVIRSRPLAEAGPAGAIDAEPEGVGIWKAAMPAQDGPDVIEGEYILTVLRSADRALLEALARRYGIDILDQYGNQLRVRARDRQALAALLARAPAGTGIEANIRMRVPPVDDGDVWDAPGVPYQGFGQGALAWLGIPEPGSGWGQGLQIAILDTGVAGVAVRRRFDLVGEGVQGGHGTLVATILANMLPGAELLDFQVMHGDGTGDSFTVARGIREAVDAGAGIINMSIGTRGDSGVLADAVRYAVARGVLIVASAGNEGVARLLYPAAYPGVLSVAAVDAAERHLHFSNRGERVDLAAPGIGIAVPNEAGELLLFSGTSAAAPFVAATAGLAAGLYDGLQGAALRAFVISMANDTGEPGVNPLTGAGIVSPARVLEHGQSGIVDIAVLRPYFHVDSEGVVKEISVAAQNRGTLDLDVVEMVVTVNGTAKQLTFAGVTSGRTIAYRMDAADYVRPDGVWDVSIQAAVPGDVRPDNNQLRSVRLAQP